MSSTTPFLTLHRLLRALLVTLGWPCGASAQGGGHYLAVMTDQARDAGPSIRAIKRNLANC